MVASYLQLLQKRYQGQLDRDANDFIHFAVDGASRMQQMINDLLVFSRVTTRGKEMVPASSEDALSHALENLRDAIQDTKSKVNSAGLPAVNADPLQLTMLFQHLVGNAIKFRGEAPLEVKVSARNVDGMQEFCVADNGIGIASDSYERIFGIFQKLHARTDYPGTGIGLAVCSRIAARHGGKIWVESEPGQGSRFYFTLPSAPQAQAQPAHNLQAERA
jgi:light-regulated signal transduction histidine kinase (bacteriophytochrome)